MKSAILGLFASVLMLYAGAARSDVIYQFTVTNIGGNPSRNFTLSLRYDDYVTVTGINQLPVALTDSVAAIGFPVAYAGTNTGGVWAFDDAIGSSLTDVLFWGAETSFLFTPLVGRTTYYDAPGTFAGSALIATNVLYGAPASLTIREVGIEVPEPVSLSLLGVGLVGLALWRRKRAG